MFFINSNLVDCCISLSNNGEYGFQPPPPLTVYMDFKPPTPPLSQKNTEDHQNCKNKVIYPTI